MATPCSGPDPRAAQITLPLLFGRPSLRRLLRKGAGTALTLKDCVPCINAWAEAALARRKDIIVLCHGGPIATPEDARFILKSCPDCHGFYGASSMERLPVETALTEQTRKFKEIGRG